MSSSSTPTLRNALLASLAAGATLFGGAAFAQSNDASGQEAEPASAQPAGGSTEIVVVGSRIRRDEFSSTSPVQIVTREESVLAGLASTTDALQGTGVTGGSAQINNLFGGFVVDGGPGANTLGLRGLGATRTLVLLNGRRVAPAGTRGAVGSADLNVLPSAIVDRIEILKDGASSVYGSDAVAGVVNIITQTGIKGATVEGFYARPQDGGGEQISSSVVAGYTADKWEVSGSFEYLERTDLKLKDRDWARCNQALVPGAFIDPLTGQQRCYPINPAAGSNGVTINTIGTSSAPGVPAAATGGTRFTRWRPNSAVTTGVAGFEGVSLDSRDTFDPLMLEESLISPAKIYNGFVQGSYDTGVLGNAEAYVELLGTRRISEQTGYRQLTLDYPEGSPLIPANLQFSQDVVGAPPNTGIRAFIGFGNDVSSQEVDYYKGVAGLRGDFIIPDWKYDAYISFAKSDASYTFESFLTDRLNASLSGCPTGSPGACVVAPPVNSNTIEGDLPVAFREYIFRPVTGNTSYEETVVSGIIDGPVPFFELPAGKIQTVLGLEYRTAEIDDQPPIESINNNLFNLTSALPTTGDDSVWEAFGEIEIPILANVFLADKLTFNGSARFTDYESYGSDSTYKVGGVWSPVSFVSFRGSRGTSYRAPALFEQFQGATSGFLNTGSDPCNEYNTGDPTTTLFANCDAEIRALLGDAVVDDPDFVFRPLQGITVLSEGGAAAGLAAETSTNTSFGVVIQPPLPSWAGEFSFAVDYYDIEIEDEVTQVGGGAILDLCYNDPQFRAGGSFCRLVSERRPAQGNSLQVSDSYINLAQQTVSGYDFNLRYIRDIGPGTFRFNAQVTKFDEQASKLFPDDPIDDVNGSINAPEWTGQFDLYYDWNDWRFFWQTNWIGEQDGEEYLELSPAQQSFFDFTVNDYATSNASVRYRSPRKWEFTVGVRNVFDLEPPVISAGFYNRVGNSPIYSGYDYYGRTVFVNVSKTF